MEAHHVPGAVFVMVKDGEIFLAKGYGDADVDAHRPMNPETSLVRVASISKLFTATAAMQLVEQGRLDLHADVNRYLEGFRIEEGYGEPITLHHLLTHTAGFDDRFLRSSRPLGSELPSLESYLAERMPRRVMPPGKILSYSNHGSALVGHLVATVSGMEFEDYLDRHVLGPLGMDRSRFFLAVPLSPELASSYTYRDGRYEALGHDHSLLGPAAELNTTATDMARFMIAHLQLGRLGDRRILREETARRMHERQFTHHPRLDGWCYGFDERTRNGVRTIGHGGDWRGFRSSLVLIPDARIGTFVSVNADFRGPFYPTFERIFMDRYFPDVEETEPIPPADFSERAGRYTGTYVPNRRIRDSILKLGTFLGLIRVTANEDDTLTVWLPPGSPAGDLVRLVEVGPDLFREIDGDDYAAFLSDEEGAVRHLALGPFAFDRTSWAQSPRTHALLAGLAILLFTATLVGWLLGALARTVAGAGPSPVSLTARLVGAGACLLQGVAIVGTAISLQTVNIYDLLISVPLALKLLLALALLAIPLTLALPYFAWRGISDGRGAGLARLHYWVVTVTAFLVLVLADEWNLLGLRY